MHHLNEYIFVEGRETGRGMHRARGPARVTVEDAGPLVGTLRIESDPPGSSGLTTRVRMVAGLEGIELVNTVKKERNLEPEGVYFAFPLHLPGGTARIDIPWGVVRPETDQLPGANRNYYAVQRWIDISNGEKGMTWVTPDAPMIKFAPMTLVGRGRGDSGFMSEFHEDGIRTWWHESISPGPTFYSWVMNNHWEVNYKAFQEGEATFRYLLVPHAGDYDGTEAEKLGRSYCQPFAVVERDRSDLPGEVPFRISGSRIIATSLTCLPGNDGFRLRLYNPNPGTEVTWIQPAGDQKLVIEYADPSGDPTGKTGNSIGLPGYGVATLRIQNNLQLSDN